MVKISRREKKLAEQRMDVIKETKQKEALMSQDPTVSYKRKIIHTNMPWPLELIQMGRSDVLVLIVIAAILVIACATIGLYFFIKWILSLFGVMV